MLLTRVRPHVFLPGLGLLWGTFACLMATTQNWSQMAAMRFLLGIAEVCNLRKLFAITLTNMPPLRPVLPQAVLSICHVGTGDMN